MLSMRILPAIFLLSITFSSFSITRPDSNESWSISLLNKEKNEEGNVRVFLTEELCERLVEPFDMSLEGACAVDITQPLENQDDYDEELLKEMEQVYESSPVEAQQVVEHLQRPELLKDPSGRYAIFVGPPGSGKSMMAKAIAYKLKQESGWESKFISVGGIVGDKRNQTTVRLQKMLKNIVDKDKPTIIIIDELNKLLEHTESEHHDTDMTATCLWAFLDEQRGNNNFFLIGTMNQDTRLPQAFKSRILPNRIDFELFTANAQRMSKKVLVAHAQLHEKISNE